MYSEKELEVIAKKDLFNHKDKILPCCIIKLCVGRGEEKKKLVHFGWKKIGFHYLSLVLTACIICLQDNSQ